MSKTFNSLFEMLEVAARGAGWRAELSILYLRCIMQIAGGQKKADILSILYLRCVVSLNGRGYAVKEITFNSLFEMPSSRRIVAVS